MPDISLCMIVKDEAENLEHLLPRVMPWVDEAVIVDTGSKDDTRAVIKKHGGKIYRKKLRDSFSEVRNHGLSKAKSEWILMLDADETVRGGLLFWIQQWIERVSDDVDGLYIWRENRIDKILLPKFAYEPHLRLFRRGRFEYEGALHERPTYVGKEGTPVCQLAPPVEDMHIIHWKSSERQEVTNRFYREFAARIGDERLREIQEGDGDVVWPPQMEWGIPLKLNLGSSSRRYPGYLNVDMNAAARPDILADLRKGLPIVDETVDEIVAEHILEHFSYHEVTWVLADWIRTLKVGGVITICTPDLDYICRGFVSGEVGYLRAIQLLFGGQSVMDLDSHYTSLNEGWLRGQLLHWGCDEIERRTDLPMSHYLDKPEEELIVTATKVKPSTAPPDRSPFGVWLDDG